MEKPTDMQKTSETAFCNVVECKTNLGTSESKPTSELSKNSKSEEQKSIAESVKPLIVEHLQIDDAIERIRQIQSQPIMYHSIGSDTEPELQSSIETPMYKISVYRKSQLAQGFIIEVKPF